MNTMFCVLLFLAFFGKLLQAAPIEPATVDIPPAKSDDLFPQLRVQSTTIQPTPSQEHKQQSNTSDSNNEREQNLFPPETLLTSCRGSFSFSVKTSDSSTPLNVSSIFPNYKEGCGSSGSPTGDNKLTCITKSDYEKGDEIEVYCSCKSESGNMFTTFFVLSIVIPAIAMGLFFVALEYRQLKKEIREKSGNNTGYQSVPQSSLGMKEKEAVVEQAAADDIGEDFDDSNYPMG